MINLPCIGYPICRFPVIIKTFNPRATNSGRSLCILGSHRVQFEVYSSTTDSFPCIKSTGIPRWKSALRMVIAAGQRPISSAGDDEQSDDQSVATFYTNLRLNSEKNNTEVRMKKVRLIWEKRAVVKLALLCHISLANWSYQSSAHDWSPVFSRSLPEEMGQTHLHETKDKLYRELSWLPRGVSNGRCGRS